MKQKILSYMDEHKEELFENLCSMISINTENNGKSGHEKPLAFYIQSELEKLGIESDVYSPDDIENIFSHEDYLEGRGLAERTNVTGILKGKGTKKSLMLAAHLDTVPIGDKALWTVEPIKGIINDGKIWGRGACDDKYALAAWLFLAKAIKELRIELDNDLYLTGYVDEEFGGGNGALACSLKYPTDLCINLDCKDFLIWHCASGGRQLEIDIKHKESQDSCLAVMAGLEIVKDELLSFGQKKREELESNPFYRGTVIPASALRILTYGCGFSDNDMHVGRVRFEYCTDRSAEEIEKECTELYSRIDAKLAPMGMQIDKVIYEGRLFKYGYTDPDNENILLLKDSAMRAAGIDPRVCGSCQSDLSVFLANTKGTAFSFGIGRGFGEYGGAHQPDEYIECEKLLNFAKILAHFVLSWDETNK
jgi:acetylornithine deacetylase